MATHHPDDEATISIPSLLFVGILIFFSYRYFFARGDSSSSSSTSSATRPGQNGLRFTAAQVEQVSAMFPQLNRRDIMWDLHRNRGSVQATAERVMAGVGLDPAPPSFQPPITFTTTSSTPAAGGSQAKKQEVDLITRYNLQSKISGKGKEKEEETPAPGWYQDKTERAKVLQRRRDEMILAARRKMMERDAAAAGTGAGAGDGAASLGS